MNRVLVAVAASVLVSGIAAPAGGVTGQSFRAHLNGDAEVPARDTHAVGQTVLQLSADGTELAYRLNVANIDNVTAAHIHVGPASENGPVVAHLYGTVSAGGGRVNGPIAADTITASDLVGPLAGAPLAELVSHIEAGNAYVNVHTNDGAPPLNSGPGDFPGGEIRGQIETRGIDR